MVKPKENPTKTKTPSLLLVYIHPSIFLHSVCHSFVLLEVRPTALPFSRAINEKRLTINGFLFTSRFWKNCCFGLFVIKIFKLYSFRKIGLEYETLVRLISYATADAVSFRVRQSVPRPSFLFMRGKETLSVLLPALACFTFQLIFS